RMEHYMENKENGRIILNSVQNGLLIWPTVTKEDGTIRTKKYKELSATEKIQAECDCKATNIVLQHRMSMLLLIIIKLQKRFGTEVKHCLVVLVFNPGDDPIACLKKAMAFLIVVASSRFPSTNNQVRTSSNPRNQATIQDDRLQCNKFKGGKDKVILVLVIRVM
ncbi:hypothetical protein Tco_1551221, partial [Tanacetum coccineum]